MSLFAVKPIERVLADGEGGEHQLKKTLSASSLVALGIGAIIGAGLFSLTGVAASKHAGPAVILSMVVAAIGCAFAAFCYSEFACMIPVAGSAYTYAYATLGEYLAWIIGWDLVLEYAVGATTVAVSWSGYVISLLRDFGLRIPDSLASGPFEPQKLPDGTLLFGLINLPAVLVVVAVSMLLMIGIQESARANAVIVFTKVTVVIVFILLGWGFIEMKNYSPFIPDNPGDQFQLGFSGFVEHFGIFGWSGIVRGAAVIFFAYIGFDAVSTAAQEAKNPKRDMPIGIIGSLVICTVLYVLFSYVLTGMVNYKDLAVSAPVAVAIDKTNLPWLMKAVKFGIICGYTSVILVMLLGQSRVFYSMSRDGLLPALFSEIHSKWLTPWKSNLLFCVAVAIMSALLPMTVVGEMTSIGTLFAFVVVCAAVLIMRKTHPDRPRPFRVPWVPLIPILGIVWNFAMMLSLGWANWGRLIAWFVIGQVVFFLYSRKHSHLTGVNKT